MKCPRNMVKLSSASPRSHLDLLGLGIFRPSESELKKVVDDIMRVGRDSLDNHNFLLQK